MCRRKYVRDGTSGYPLEYLNKTLGDSKDICSLLEASVNEDREMISKIWVEDIHEDIADVVAEDTMGHLSAGKKVFWKNLYKRDVAFKAEEMEEEKADQEERRMVMVWMRRLIMVCMVKGHLLEGTTLIVAKGMKNVRMKSKFSLLG